MGERPSGWVRRFDFGEGLARAHVRSGGLLVDFGAPSRHKHTLADWRSGFFGDFERGGETYSYMTGSTARVFFHALEEEEGGGTIAVRARPEGTSQVRVYLNDKLVGTLALEKDRFSHGMVAFDSGIVTGKNEIKLQGAGKRRTSEGPPAVMALDYLRVVPGDMSDGPAASSFDTFRYADPATGKADIVLTGGESLTYYLPVPPHARIQGEARCRAPGASGKISVAVRSDRVTASVVQDVSVGEEGTPFEVDLTGLAGEAAEISLVGVEGEVLLRETELATKGEKRNRASGKPQAKSFILVLIDTLRSDKIDLYNRQTRVRSPFVSGLGESATVFERAFAPENWTKPSVASLLTGLYPTSHQTKDDRDKLPESTVTIQDHLKSLGFETVGFVANGYVSGKFGFKRGWDSWTNYVREGKRNRAEFVTADAIAWLEKRTDDKPFFLYVHTIDPHVPYIPPKKYLSMYDVGPYNGPIDARKTAEQAERIKSGAMKLDDRDKMRWEALYDGEITYHDDQLVHLTAKLAELELLEDTLVIVTADHGEEFFDHGKVGHGHTLYEELLHVPLLIRMPGPKEDKAGARVPEEVSLVDVFPTACDILGVECPAGIEGTSLVPLLTGEPWEAFPSVAFSEFLTGQRAARMGRYKIILRGLRTSLFDLTEDPGETEDLSEARPVALATLFDALAIHLGIFIDSSIPSGEAAPKKRHKQEKAVIDPETRRQLRALGYLGDDE